jgi:RNase P subunit RPR2
MNMKTTICPDCKNIFEPEPDFGPIVEYSTHVETSAYIPCPFCDFELRVTYNDEKQNSSDMLKRISRAWEAFFEEI